MAELAEAPSKTDLAASTEMAASSGFESDPSSEVNPRTRSGLIAIAGIEGADLWNIPNGSPFLTLPTSTRLTASGRSADGSWILVHSEDAVGWTPATGLIAFNLLNLPVLEETDVPVIAGSVVKAESREPDVAEETAVGMSIATGPETIINDTLAQSAVYSQDMTATVALDESRLNVRSGPGTEYSIVAKAYPGEEYIVLGRERTGDWIQIDLRNGEGDFGWVSSEYIDLSDLASNLPVSEDISTAPARVQASLGQGTVVSERPSAIAQTTPNTASNAGLKGILVFQTSNGGTIYVYRLESGDLQPLTYGFDPAISPDGGTVAFTRDGGENGLYLIDIDGSNERLIFSGRAGLRSPTWSADGNWIAFSRTDEFTECRRFGRGGCVSDEELAKQGLSPGDFPLVREYSQKLARVDTNGNNYRDLATLNSAQSPNWNEAGIVYQSEAGLQITDDTPDAVNRLVVFDYLKPYYEDPSWQPNGGRIVYQGREASHMEIFAINPDGSGQVALTKPATVLVEVLPSNVSPAWSPDGEYIVFLSDRDENNSAGAWQLWVMDADGSNQRPLPLGLPFEYSFGGEQMVSWGP